MRKRTSLPLCLALTGRQEGGDVRLTFFWLPSSRLKVISDFNRSLEIPLSPYFDKFYYMISHKIKASLPGEQYATICSGILGKKITVPSLVLLLFSSTTQGKERLPVIDQTRFKNFP